MCILKYFNIFGSLEVEDANHVHPVSLFGGDFCFAVSWLYL